MYAYLTKGMTVGHVLTRLVLREITSIPGIILDLILAMFWIPDYTSYWAEGSAYIDYTDGTRHHGVMQGVFGWIGEALGFVIGAPIGLIGGAILFFPDLLLRGLFFLNDKIHQHLNDFVLFIGKTSFFENLPVYDSPKNYLQKSWNLGAATLGMAFAALPYTAAKILEFFLPFLKLDHAIAVVCSTTGALLGCAVAIVLYPPIYVMEKIIDLIDLCRDAVFHAVALIYGKSGQVPVGPDDARNECIPHQAVHSEEFRDQVTHYANTSWTQMIFGPLKEEGPKAQPEPYNPNGLIDPFTHDPLGVNGIQTVIDPHGHTFNDDKGTGSRGIRFWVQTKHECPLTHQLLTEADLIPNRAFNDLRATQLGLYPTL